MQNPFKMLGDLNQMRKQAAVIQKALESQEFTVREGNAEVVITGNQNVKSVKVDGAENESLKRAFNNAIKQSQQAAASQLTEITKSMNMQ